MKKYLKIIYKTLIIFFGILFVLYIIAYAYISSNKQSIITKITGEIGKRMNGKVYVQDLELSFFRHFPKASLMLKNVSVTDSMFAQHKHPLFHASSLFANISIIKLLTKQPPLNGLTIEKGEFYLYTDTSGYTNTYLFTPKKDSSAGAKSDNQKNELESIALRDVSLILDDRRKQKFHSFFVNNLDVNLDDKADVFLLHTEADIVIHSLAFNVPRGSFAKEKELTGKFELRLDKKLNQLQFDSINIKLSGQPFNLTGRFDLKKDSPQFVLRAHTRGILYDDGRSLMTEKIARSLSIIQLDKPLDIDASISGPLNGGDPLVYATWTAKETGLKTPFLDLDSAFFTGYYSNELVKGLARNDPNSIININNFQGRWNGIPLASANIKMLNLEKPILTCDITSDFPLTNLNNFTGSSFLQVQSGNGSININYNGPIEKNTNTNSFLNGTISFKDGTIFYTPRNVRMDSVNGQLIFKNSDVFVNDLRCVVLNNKVLMQGEAKNMLTLMNTEPGKATINWIINTPSFNLGNFIFLLKPRENVPVQSKSKIKLSSTASKIDEVLEKASLNVKLHASNLYYKKFQAANVNADISLLENKYLINNVSMEHGGGSVDMNGSLTRQKSNYLQATINTSMKNVDVSKVLYAFDDFGQDGITAQNLAGKLTTKIDASLGIDEDARVVPSSVKSNIVFSLKNGALINYEPIKKLQNILFKNRDFDNIRFAELKDSLEVANSDIKINRMEIQSSVLSFFVEGIYSMKGNTDLSIQIPLNNLKKRDADYKPENIGTQKKAGRSIYVRGRTGSDGNVSFKLDLFNKFRKQKQKDEK